MLELSFESVNFESVSSLSDIFFDDVNQKVCTVRGGGAMGITARGPTPRDVVTCRLKDKGEIISMKLSPDCKTIAVQRTATAVDFVIISSNETEPSEFGQSCKGKNSRILGLEWTSNNEILFITDRGLELYLVQSEKRSVKNIKVYNLSINWFVYCPQNQLLVASSGTLGTVLNPFIVKNGSFTRLAKFEVDFGYIPQLPKLSLLDRDVTIGTIYGKVYFLVLRHSPRANVSGAEVLVYELSRDYQQPARKLHILQLGLTGKFAIHILDNLVIVHHQASKFSLVFDIKMAGVWDGFITNHQPILPQQQINVPEQISADPETGYDNDIELYAPSWVVFPPDIIIDAKSGCMWHLKVKLEPSLTLIPDKTQLIRFLMHRRGGKRLLLKVLKSSVKMRQVKLSDLTKIFDWFTEAYCEHVIRINQSAAITTTDVLCPDVFEPVIMDQPDLYSNVFHPLMDDEETNQHFLVDILLQYLLALQQKKIEVQPFLHELLVCGLVKCGNFQKLHQLLQYRVVTDSKPIAFLLVSHSSRFPAALQSALDMLSRLGSAVDEIVEVLLSKQLVIEALRYVESCGQIDRVNPMKFVECAWQCDRHIRYTVFKHFQDKNIKLRGTTRFDQSDNFDQYMYEFKRLFVDDIECEGEWTIVDGND